jgi:dihydrofolate synthase/folylpolyglutamate synthase
MQIIHDSPQWLLDVAHNPHAARQLAHYIHSHPVSGKTYALFSMLKGKDIKQVLELMDQNIDEWHIVGLDSARGLAIDELKQLFNERNIKTSVITHRSFKAACESLKNITKVEDRVVAFGSFLVVSAVLDSCN